MAGHRLASRIQVLGRAGWHSLRPRRRPEAPARVLVAHHLLLGDTIMLTPLLAKLSEQWPEAEIVMTVAGTFRCLYQGAPYGVRAYAYDPRDSATLRRLDTRGGFDLGIVPGDNRYSWLARALGARWIVAFDGDRPGYKNWPVDELVPYSRTAAAWGDMVAGLVPGAPPAPYHPRHWPAPQHRPFDRPVVPYCVLHVGASSPLKQWPDSAWHALAEHLTQRGWGVVWSAGPGEQAVVQRIDPAGRYASYAGRLDLAQLWHLLTDAELLVSPDTGVAHLGRLVGCPTVTLFGPGSSTLYGAGEFWSRSPYAALDVDIECRDQRLLFRREIDWVRRCSRGPAECSEARCMTGITPARVIAAIDRVKAS